MMEETGITTVFMSTDMSLRHDFEDYELYIETYDHDELKGLCLRL